MKISITSHGKTTTIEINNDDIYVDDLGTILYDVCIAQGWNKGVLKRIFKKNENR